MTISSPATVASLAGRGWLFWLSSVLLTALAAFLIWLFFFVPWRSIEIDQGLGERALRFPYLAAQEFLSSRGIESQQIRGLDTLSSEDGYASFAAGDTLLLIDSYRALSQDAAMELLFWVAEGGKVILSSRNPFLEERNENLSGDSDPIFDSIDYRVVESTSSEHFPYSAYRERVDTLVLPADAEVQSPDGTQDGERTLEDLISELDDNPETALSTQLDVFKAESCFEETPRSQLDIDSFENITSENVAVQFLGNRYLQQLEGTGPGVTAVRSVDSRGAQIVSTEFVEGRITLTTDNHIWSNYRIGCYDHAYLLSALTQGSGKVWILLNETSASLGSVLWRSFTLGISLLALVLVLWIWNQLVRFGPIFEDDNRTRRSLLEHIDASAAFLYRKKLSASLLNELLAQIQQRCERLHRGFTSLPLADRANLLAEHTQLVPAEIELLLSYQSADSPTLSEAEFVKRVELCQKIRKKL